LFVVEMTFRAAPILFGLGLVSAALAGQWMLGGTSRGGVDRREAGGVVGGGGAAAMRLEPTGGTPVPTRTPAVDTGLKDYHGVEAGVSCMTCHSTREPHRANGVGGALPKTFHQGLAYVHAGQSCLSCHHADDYDSLRLADGRKLAFRDSQQLCAQCHGPQTRDYLNGSHGGMRGYWDKSRGGRERNSCIDCHDPHAPAFPAMIPVFAPRDAAARQQAEREKRQNLHD
jgi:formate-dependent nitrite reductase cytochrome c552 subunit